MKSTFETKRHSRLVHFCFDKVEPISHSSANEGERISKAN